ncbi:uncharacterized membrane protein HdeD (DUF308 family) [Paenibacillus sp. 4624]|jgi:uncharacterized membrane protein HdeD (DUF308 family)|uniref:Uncharacterized protein n=1 Tax=Paenibacillus amylolyticus TaxID=1451 RepID=A0A5M9WQ75_PAEAM|nr:hypothetical protein [Paenibacillus amylolyticus]KAA8783683.1 hypothetical protein EC604_07470 [Paenibacillus amylolyticus]
MKIASMLGILLLAGTIIYVEWKRSEEKKVRMITAGISAVSAVIGTILLFDPRLPGPGLIIKLLFGSIDKVMK